MPSKRSPRNRGQSPGSFAAAWGTVPFDARAGERGQLANQGFGHRFAVARCRSIEPRLALLDPLDRANSCPKHDGHNVDDGQRAWNQNTCQQGFHRRLNVMSSMSSENSRGPTARGALQRFVRGPLARGYCDICCPTLNKRAALPLRRPTHFIVRHRHPTLNYFAGGNPSVRMMISAWAETVFSVIVASRSRPRNQFSGGDW